MHPYDVIVKKAEERGFQRGLQLCQIIRRCWLYNVHPSVISDAFDMPIERVNLLIAEFEKEKEINP